jgi:RNA polymerase sigma-70 factor (ECF subfamily)
VFINPGVNISAKTDEELITLYQSSKELNVLGKLYQRYTHLVFGVCMKYLKDQEKSKDAVMDIFEKLIHDLKSHKVSNFKSWLYTVTRNHCLMHLRKEKQQIKHHQVLVNDTREIMESFEVLHLNGEESREAEVQLLEKAIGQLGEEQRKCIELFYLKNLCYGDVAKATQYSLKEVKSYIQNGKRNLKLILLNHEGKRA